MWPVKLSRRALFFAMVREVAIGTARLMKPHAVAVSRHALELFVRFGLWL